MQEEPPWLRAMFPWPQSELTVNRRRMAYVDEGPASGRPVLLLHGNPTWALLYRDFVGPLTAAHFLQDDRGPDIAAEIASFLDRVLGPSL